MSKEAIRMLGSGRPTEHSSPNTLSANTTSGRGEHSVSRLYAFGEGNK
jgi:hypothetical protein